MAASGGKGRLDIGLATVRLDLGAAAVGGGDGRLKHGGDSRMSRTRGLRFEKRLCYLQFCPSIILIKFFLDFQSSNFNNF